MLNLNIECIKRIEAFLEEHKDNFHKHELETMRDILTGKKVVKELPINMHQIFYELGYDTPKNDIYDGFIRVIQKHFNIDSDIVEVGGGYLPYLAQKIAQKQQHGTITVYDPKLIFPRKQSPNLILHREMFNNQTQCGNPSLIIGFMPCEAVTTIIDYSCKNDVEFMVALCEGGLRKNFEWLESDEEWVSFIKGYATGKIRELENSKNPLYDPNQFMTRSNEVVKTESLEEYGDKYPVIYYKRKKS